MVNLDKLLKSFENLKVFHSGMNVDDPLSSASKLKTKDASINKRDKILNCNVIADTIGSSQLKSAPEFPKFLSLSMELFLSLCDDAEPDVRIVADECLNRVIKSLLDTNVSRLQVELYKEVKKNETKRSLRAALLKFADLCHFIKPQKCRPYIVNLLPCLTKINQRDDEGIQECLATAMVKICPVLMSFATDLETKMLMKSFLSNTRSSSANTRRTSAVCLALVCTNSRKPKVFFQWLINYLIDHLSSSERMTDTKTLHGLLLVLRHLLLSLPDIISDFHSDHQHLLRPEVDSKVATCDGSPSCTQMLKVLEVIVEHLNHSDHSIINASLECLLQLLRNINPIFHQLLLTPGSFEDMRQLADDRSTLQEATDALKTPELSFQPLENMDLFASSDVNVMRHSSSTDLSLVAQVQQEEVVQRRSDVEESAVTSSEREADESTLDVSEAIQAAQSFSAAEGDIGDLRDDDEAPIIYLARLLCSKFLLSGNKGGLIPDRQVRVSIKVLAVHSLSLIVRLHPGCLLVKLHKSIDGPKDEEAEEEEGDCQGVGDVLLYVSHSDPQLKGNVALLIGSFISSEASCECRADAGEFSSSATCEVDKYLSLLMDIYDDESSVATRSAIKALHLSLPFLMERCHGNAALSVLLSLLNLKANCYWLVKVEFLQLLSTLNFKTLFFLESCQVRTKGLHLKVNVQEMVLDRIITLLGDDDHRVRQAAVASVCRIIPHLFYSSDEIHSCPLMLKAAQMLLQYLPGQTSRRGSTLETPRSHVGLCHKVESALSRVVTRVMKCLSQSSSKNFTLGCCSALYELSEEYPVHVFVGAWLSLFKQPTSPVMQNNSIMSRILPRSKSSNGISNTTLPHALNSDDCSMTLVGGPLLFILSTLTSSPLSHDLYFHSEALKLAGNLFLGTAIHNFKHPNSDAEQPQAWSSLSDKYLSLLGDKLFVHVLRMLSVFQHVVEDLNPNSVASKSLPTPPSLSPIKRKAKVVAGKEGDSSQGRTASTNQDKPSVKETVREGLGSFVNIQHYVHLYSVIKSSYFSFKISPELSSDRVLHLLKSVLIVLSQQLELASLNEVSRCAEEILSYLASTFSLEPSTSLLCVRQLLRSIFGTNMTSEEAIRLSNRQQVYSSQKTSQVLDSSSIFDVCFKLPIKFFQDNDGGLHATDNSSLGRKGFEKVGQSVVAKILSKTERTSVGAYIKLFEPLVIRALKQYTLTSLPAIQLQVLDLLTTLVQLRVNYCLLDSDQIFIGFVLKQIEMIETGQSRSSEGCLPQIFNFLVHLSFEKYHNKSIITMSKVIQLCDGIIASGLEPSQHAVPCLQHIVSALFVSASENRSDLKELEPQREVVVSMLLRLLRFCEVLRMLSIVLKHSRAEEEERTNKLSRQISDHLFPALVKQEILIENSEDLACVSHLLDCLSPCVFRPIDILINMLLTVPCQVTEDTKLSRWAVQVVCCLSKLLSLPEKEVVLFKVNQIKATPPLFSFPGHELFSSDDEDSGEMLLARFPLAVVEKLMAYINKESTSAGSKKKIFLCNEMMQLLVLFEQLLYAYPEVLISLKQLMMMPSPSSPRDPRWSRVTLGFARLLPSHPLLFLRWSSIISLVVPERAFLDWWDGLLPNNIKTKDKSPNEELIRKAGVLLICQRTVENQDGWSVLAVDWLVDNCIEDIIRLSHEEMVKKLMSSIYSDVSSSGKFCAAMKKFYDRTEEHQLSTSFVRLTLKCLEGVHRRHVGVVMEMLVSRFFSSCHLSITKIVDRMVCNCAEVLLAMEAVECRELIGCKDVVLLLERLKSLKMKKCQLSSLLAKLVDHLSGEDDPPVRPSGLVDEIAPPVKSFGEEEYTELVRKMCLDCSNLDSTACSLLLKSLDRSTVLSILVSEDCSALLLKSCMKLVASESRSKQLMSWLPSSSSSSSSPPTSSSSSSSSSSQMFEAALFALQRSISRIVSLLPTPYKYFDRRAPCTDAYSTRMNDLCSDPKLFHSTFELAQALEVYLTLLSSSLSPSSSSSAAAVAEKKSDIPESNIKDMCRFCIFCLEAVHWHVQEDGKVSSIEILLSLSCLTLSLSVPQINNHFSSSENFLFVCSAVHLVHSLLSSFVAHSDGVLVKLSSYEQDFPHFSDQLDELNMTTRTCDLMCELILCLSTHLNVPGSNPPPVRPLDQRSLLPLYLKPLISKLIIALGRTSLVNSYARTPSLVWTMGWSPTPTGGNKTKLPPIPLEFLQDKDVLSDYVFRASAIGWTNRQQFEETWMSLLAVLNPVPHDFNSSSHHEESLERTFCQILSMRAITSLLLSSTLTPHPGNPSLSLFSHKPRNKFLEFFKTSNGQKLFRVKVKLEMEMRSLMTDEKLDPASMIPLVSNIEREAMDSSYCPAQFSTTSIVSSVCPLQRDPISSSLNTVQPNLVDAVQSTAEGETTNSPPEEIIPPVDAATTTCSAPLTSLHPPHDIDIHSCLQFLLELYGSFLSSSTPSSPLLSPSPKVPLNLLHETVRSILLLSDVFTERAQYEWMLMMMVDIIKNHPNEDELLTCYVVLATCKAAAVVGVDSNLVEKIVKLVEGSLRSTHLPTKIFTLYGGLFLLEADQVDVARTLIPIYVDYLVRSLSSFTPSTIHSQQHALVMWSLSFYILENYYQDVKELEFPAKFIQICTSAISTYQDSTPLPIYSAIFVGLERLAVSQSVDRECLVKLATDRFCQQNTHRSLIAFNLMITCMYADYLRPKEKEEEEKEEEGDFPSSVDASMKIMERVTVIFDRIRKGLPHESAAVMKVLPLMLMDFFEGHEIMNKIIVEFLNNQQPQTQLFAGLLFQVFDHLLKSNQSQLVINWVMLSLSNFTQRTPLSMAVWSLTCVFICSTTSRWLRSIYPMVFNRVGLMEGVDVHLFLVSAMDFYSSLLINNQSHAKSFLGVFTSVASLHPDSPYRELVDSIHALDV